jgi:hypothetical protein
LSSGGAGGDTQAAPDKASCEKRYPALTCNDLFGDSSPLAFEAFKSRLQSALKERFKQR